MILVDEAELRLIGPFVDSYAKDEAQVKLVRGYRTLRFEDGEVSFVPFTGVYRHRVDEIYRVA